MFLFHIDTLDDYYIFNVEDNYLSIPKISLKNKIYEVNDEENIVDKNIQLIKDNIDNYVLAGHNGNVKIAYFKNLDKLVVGDLIYFYYHGVLRIYQLNKVYEIKKNGYFKIQKYSFPVINLITCKKDSNTLQVVYVGYLLK